MLNRKSVQTFLNECGKFELTDWGIVKNADIRISSFRVCNAEIMGIEYLDTLGS